MEMTPAPIEKYNKISSSEYEMKLNGENFTVKLELYSVTINFISMSKNSLFPLYYKSNYKLEEMKNLSKSFTLFDSIKDIYQCIKEILDEGKGKIFFAKDNFVISIPLFLPTGKQESIYFYLNKNNLEKDDVIHNLCKRIIELENKIKENEKIKNEQITNILERLQILEEKEKKREKEEKEKKEKEEKENMLKDIKESSICKNNEISFFTDELKKHEKFLNKDIGFKLLFKSSKDGDKLSKFHDKCDNIQSVLLLIKTNKGIRFGGYTEVGFNSKGSGVNDNKAFIFSLDKKEIYINKANPAIYCKSELIGFKNTIYIYNNFLSNNKNMIIGATDQYACSKYELNNGEENFSISDFEIFQIITK